MVPLVILSNSRVNPYLSEYAYLLGPYYFNKSPMAPPRTRVVFHNKPGNLISWGHHGTKGWYIGPSLEHYIFMQFYTPTTGIVLIIDTLQYTLQAFASQKKPQKIICNRQF